MIRFKISKFLLLIILNQIFFVHSFAYQNDEEIQIGIVVDKSLFEYPSLIQQFESEIVDLTEAEFMVNIPEDKILEVDLTTNAIRFALNSLYNDETTDIVIALGLASSHVVCQQDQFKKPTIAPFVFDEKLQNIVREKGFSGKKNLCYISRNSMFKSGLIAMQDVASFNKIAVLVSSSFLKLIPNFEENLKEEITDLNLAYEIIPIGDSAEEILSSISKDTEAVYTMGLNEMDAKEFRLVIDGLIDRQLLSFSALGPGEVEQGIMMTDTPTDFYKQRARRVALNVQRILLVDDPDEIPVAFSVPGRTTINVQTSKAIKVFPSWDVVTEAKIIGEELAEKGPRLSLFDVVEEALNKNLNLKTKEQSLESGEKDVQLAWAGLLPQVDLAATGLQVDADRAKSSFGQQAEKTLTGSATISQLLFSDRAWANVTIQNHLHASRINEYEQARLDLALRVSIAYLNILRAKTNERIQKDNLKVLRSNLETARMRESIGSAGPGEVFRWEAEVATGQNRVIEALVQREIAEQNLNKILDKPLNHNFTTVETNLNDPKLITSKDRLYKIINNPWAYDIFSDFVVSEALSLSPEIKQLDKNIQALERYYRSTKLSFWLPDFALQAQLNNVFNRSGEGSTPPDFGDAFPGIEQKDFSWNVAINGSINLLKGGAKIYESQQAYIELKKLKTQREDLRQKIEQSTRITMKNSRRTGANLKLSEKAAEASNKNLEIIARAYARGALSILELLDAQNAAMVTEQVAANAAFDYLIDILEVQRRLGLFDFFATDEERDAWILKFENYYNQRIAE